MLAKWPKEDCNPFSIGYQTTGATINDRFGDCQVSLASARGQTFLTTPHSITSSVAMGIELFLKGIPLTKPRIYKLGELRRTPVF